MWSSLAEQIDTVNECPLNLTFSINTIEIQELLVNNPINKEPLHRTSCDATRLSFPASKWHVPASAFIALFSTQTTLNSLRKQLITSISFYLYPQIKIEWNSFLLKDKIVDLNGHIKKAWGRVLSSHSYQPLTVSVRYRRARSRSDSSTHATPPDHHHSFLTILVQRREHSWRICILRLT